MAKRKSTPKKDRFEVFKRDSFTCQYCGAKAPDVILEVDHIIPVSKGGTDDILNLITSCRDCNRGKRDTKLSDDSTVRKMQKQAEEIQERRELIEMMAQWQNELLQESDIQINSLEALFKSYYPRYSFTDYGKRDIRGLIKKFGYAEVYTSLEIALSYYDDASEAINKIGGICYNRKVGRS